MRFHGFSWVAFSAVLGLAGASVSSCSGANGAGGATSSGTSTPTTSTGGGMGGTGGAGGCTSAADCNGGVCLNGSCCASEAQVCATTCCAPGSVCLFDKCETPGNPCHTANDCAPGQYCETALGSQGTGGAGGGGGGGNCTDPIPLEGRCLDLPPTCDSNGMPPGCVADCQFHPGTGPLNAVEKYEWGPTAQTIPSSTDVWSTPAVGRVYDANCDGKVDILDPPDLIFVSGNAVTAQGVGTCCQCTGATNSACLTGVLRMLDGRTGKEIWSLDKPSATSIGFAGLSTAIGDIDGDGRMDIAAVTGEGFVVILDSSGNVKRTSDLPIPGHGNATFGWGGGLSIADMDGDGHPEIAYGATVFTTTNGAVTLKFTGTGGFGGGNIYEALSTFVDLDGAADKHLELLAGNTAYNADGSILWNRPGLSDGFPAVGDFDTDHLPDVVLVSNGVVTVLNGLDGSTKYPGFTLPGNGFGGPPTVADFDGDGKPEIGIAQANFYTVLKPDLVAKTLKQLWSVPNHDLSSSVTGSSVFDFEGDGRAEVIYADECFLWVFDGQTGAVRFAAPHTSFTATEASLVADVDGDGRAELLMVSNGADPSANGWKCMDANGTPQTVNGVTWTPSAAPGKAYRGIAVFGDKAHSWVGTRTLWSEHTYHVSNICDDRDSACDAPNVYGSIPTIEKRNWSLPWLNDFRQNVQDKGLFDAPDATVALSVSCVVPVTAKVSVRNIGLASLPSPVNVGVYLRKTAGDVLVGQGSTTTSLFPGQTDVLDVQLDAQATTTDTYYAKIIIDPQNITFNECRTDNDQSADEKPSCVQ